MMSQYVMFCSSGNTYTGHKPSIINQLCCRLDSGRESIYPYQANISEHKIVGWCVRPDHMSWDLRHITQDQMVEWDMADIHNQYSQASCTT